MVPTLRVLVAPRALGAHLLVVAAVAAAVWLGLWQLSAWEAARAAEAQDLSEQPAQPLVDVMGGDDPFPGQYVGQPVSLTGRWLDESTLYVADRRRDGETGYWVMTPVVVDGSGSAMPVVRGWSPTPQAPAVDGTTELVGWLQPSEGSNLPDDDRTDDVIPEMRVASVTEHVDRDLYSAFVVASSSDGAAGLASVTPAEIPRVSPVTSLKNLLYAIQWWVFGLFAVYIWQRWCRDQLEVADAAARAETRQEPEDEPVGSGA